MPPLQPVRITLLVDGLHRMAELRGRRAAARPRNEDYVDDGNPTAPDDTDF